MQTCDKSISILFKQNKGQIVELHLNKHKTNLTKQGWQLDRSIC